MSDDILDEFERPMVGKIGLPTQKRRDPGMEQIRRAVASSTAANRHRAAYHEAKRPAPSLPRVKWLERPDP